MLNLVKLYVITLILITAVGCDDKSSQAEPVEQSAINVEQDTINAEHISLACPIEGVWQVKTEQPLDVIYVITLEPEQNAGQIIVESAGREIRTQPFIIIDSQTIHLEGAHAEPAPSKILEAKGWDVLLLEKHLQLSDPPQEWMFASTGSDDSIHVSGLFDDKNGVKPLSLARVHESTKLPMPFELSVDWQISIPDGIEMRFSGDGVWGGQMMAGAKFTEPVKPTGSITSLSAEQCPIELADHEIKDGIIQTKEYGGIEVVMTGPSSFEVWVTRKQIHALAKLIDSQKIEDGQSIDSE